MSAPLATVEVSVIRGPSGPVAQYVLYAFGGVMERSAPVFRTADEAWAAGRRSLAEKLDALIAAAGAL